MAKCERARKFVVRLSGEERVGLEEMIRTGPDVAYRQLKARILLKADISEQGDGWTVAQDAAQA